MTYETKRPIKTRVLWSWMPMAGLTLGHTIWLKPGKERLLPHETVHVVQQERTGALRHALAYATPSGRVRLEAEAYAESVRHGSDLDGCARSLAGPLYLWPCSVDEARWAIRGFLGRTL